MKSVANNALLITDPVPGFLHVTEIKRASERGGEHRGIWPPVCFLLPIVLPTPLPGQGLGHKSGNHNRPATLRNFRTLKSVCTRHVGQGLRDVENPGQAPRNVSPPVEPFTSDRGWVFDVKPPLNGAPSSGLKESWSGGQKNQ